MSDKAGRNVLYYAIVEHKTEDAKSLILSGEFDIDAQDDKGYAAIHFASQYKEVDVVKLLLEKGANVKLQDKWGNTALARALGKGDENNIIIRMLLEAGADPRTENFSGISVLSHVKKLKTHPNRHLFERYF